MAIENFWTQSLKSEFLSIDNTFGLTAISISCTDGIIRILGKDTVGGIASTPIFLSVNQTVTFSTSGSNNLLQLDIDAIRGVCNIIGKQ
jgi:hypothetical protein